MRGKRFFALGRLKSGEMNKLEAAYDLYLKEQLNAGVILWYKFEGLKLRLANNTFLTVDFFVMTQDYELQAKDVKGGFVMEDAIVKMKVAASIYPFRFFIVKAKAKKDGGGWVETEVGG